jgi:hypothetical protein
MADGATGFGRTRFLYSGKSPPRRQAGRKLTSICVVNQTGSVVREGVVDSDPEAIAAFVRSNALVRIGLETGQELPCAQPNAPPRSPR